MTMTSSLLAPLFASLLAAAPMPGGEILGQLNIFEARPGTFAEYQVGAHDDSPAMSLRLEVMDWYEPKERSRRWIVLTAGIGPERIEMWALARRGPQDQPIRERVIVRMRDRAMEIPGEQEHEPPQPRSAELKRLGKEKLKVPAGEFQTERTEVSADGERLTLWTSTKVPLGGKLGGIVKMQSPTGPEWVLSASGVGPVRKPPTVTEPVAPQEEEMSEE